ncbi:MAG: class I SAM-dependent methyltransferase [Rhizobacter sp.]|nr:class I SAM-dependent methyltransferase [Ferruginibacter sp.]
MYSATVLAKKYFRYFLTASNGKGHGTHSPFVFDFIKLVKNDPEKYPCYPAIELLRKQLLKDKNVIEVEDFGAGSTVIKTNRRAIHKMAQSSLKPKRFAQLLFRMVKFYQPQTIVELGTSFGITSAYLACGNRSAHLYTLEGAASIAGIARKNFNALQLDNIKLIEGDFKTTLPPLLSSLDKIDFAFVDGNHKKIPTLQYFDLLLQQSHEKTILVFDDIHWSKEMEEAWDIICRHSAVTLSIDLFFIGIVFLRKDFKVKQHFSVRF